MREATLTELRNHAKLLFDAVEGGETVRVYRKGRPVADIVPVKAATPAWKRPPRARLALGGLSLSDEVLVDRGAKAQEEDLLAAMDEIDRGEFETLDEVMSSLPRRC